MATVTLRDKTASTTLPVDGIHWTSAGRFSLDERKFFLGLAAFLPASVIVWAALIYAAVGSI